jgi:ribosomal protein S18 acetylase RimI-like enzyme
MAPGGVDPGDTVRYRDATPEDMPFLREMTYEAAFWRAHAPRPTLERALENEDIARYLPRFGARGDITVIAERDGEPVGAGWSRSFPAENPGYGFVAADVPELAVAVRASSRRRGIATELMRRVIARAGERGFGRVSLSVNFDNPSAHLYRRLGFHETDSDGDSWIMVRDV